MFALTVRPCRKNSLIRRISLISKFMASQSGKETIIIHVLPNISRSKDKKTLKSCQVLKCYKENVFLQMLCRK